MSFKFENSTVNEEGAPEIKPTELVKHLNEPEIQIVDVRRPEEWSGELGHLEKAALVTLETELESKLADFDKAKTTVFVCRSGKRSSRATMMAMEQGFESVFNLEGGMLKWNAMELPKS